MYLGAKIKARFRRVRPNSRYLLEIKVKRFADKTNAAIFAGMVVRRVDVTLQERARLRLQQIDAAVNVNDLRNPPSNRLEKKRGKMKELYCLRVNDQWRICFRWKDGDAYEVQFCDYH